MYRYKHILYRHVSILYRYVSIQTHFISICIDTNTFLAVYNSTSGPASVGRRRPHSSFSSTWPPTQRVSCSHIHPRSPCRRRVDPPQWSSDTHVHNKHTWWCTHGWRGHTTHIHTQTQNMHVHTIVNKHTHTAHAHDNNYKHNENTYNKHTTVTHNTHTCTHMYTHTIATHMHMYNWIYCQQTHTHIPHMYT